jgi:type II secretory pathway predicted ATPase ExeA
VPTATTTPNKVAAMLRHFDLFEHPFTLSDSPRWQFVTGTIRSSLDRLLMCISNRNGLASIIGPYGVGKSMLVRRLQEAMTSYGGSEVRLISNPNLTGLQLLKLICEIYGLEKVRQRDEQLDVFKRFVIDCFDRDIHPVLIIDEAHELSSGHGGFGGFSLLKLLNNYAGGEGRAISIVLSGTDKLRDKLRRHEEVLSRIAANANLNAFSEGEFVEMLAFRLDEAQYAGDSAAFFDPEAIQAIHAVAQGIPRHGVVLAGLAMEAAYRQKERRVTLAAAKEAIASHQIVNIG